MREQLWARRTLVSVLIAAIGMPPAAWADQLALVQYPAGGAVRQPAPNVILTLDDSGSMGYYTGGGTTQNETRTTSRMYALKTALRTLFDASAQNIPDGSIRLAWNTMNNCRSIPSNSGGCGNLNRMRVLDATHRANFLNWVGTPGVKTSVNLTASGSTPTHHAYIAAGDYLANGSTTNAESPWANVPGTTLGNPVLSCRRSYNVLMTDGGWNFSFASHGTDVARPSGTTAPNVDGTNRTLPDGTLYDVTSANTRIYRDSWGRTISGYPVSTLADLAFYYWATDLTPGLTNNLRKLTERSGTETFSGYALPEYWNPRNNPATWQHMTTYTIGFGDAAEWRTALTYAGYPQWDLSTNDNFGGSLPDMIAGIGARTAWPNPFKGPNGSVSTLSLEESNNLNLDAASTNEDARKTELWHMAINSRGKFIASTSAESLVAAFREIFSKIIADNSTPVSSFASASGSISRSATTQYTSGYLAEDWRGYVLADTLSQDPTTGVVSTAPDAGWGTQNTTPANVTTANKLDALAAADIPNRLILTWSESGARGTSFQWTQDATSTPVLSGLSTAQKNLLKVEGAGTVSDAAAEQRLKFIRGDLTQDGKTYESTPFRLRKSRQGDIVNSALWYVADPVSNYAFDSYAAFAKTYAKRLPMVYVGGNDGMLHGFSGVDGSEKIAYVPKGVIANLPELTRPSYSHRYYVDGSPFSGDVNVGTTATPDWRTMLVGTLGAGGKGYFVLDVTNPGSSQTGSSLANDFVKTKAATLVVMDKTSVAGATTEDADIGHIFAPPVVDDTNALKSTQIARMNNGRWAVVMGNGYNSTNERPALLIQYLDGGKELLKIVASAATGTGNGLSAPRLVDLDGNGTVDLVYAGDLRGNLWKFDVTKAAQTDWRVDFSGQPLYTASYTSGNVSSVQPITAPPIVRANERNVIGLMVAFGTGRNLTEGDRTDTSVQSIYSVLDSTRYKIESTKVVVDDSGGAATPVGSGVSSLVQQTVGTSVTGSGVSTSRTFWTISQNAVAYTGTGAKKGWYLNLPASGERVLAQMGFYDSSNIIELISEVPASGGSTTGESCEPASTAVQKYRTLLNIMDGLRPSVQVMDTNGDGLYTAADGYTSRMTASSAENRVTAGNKEIRVGNDRTDKLARLPEIPLRPNWRQLQ